MILIDLINSWSCGRRLWWTKNIFCIKYPCTHLNTIFIYVKKENTRNENFVVLNSLIRCFPFKERLAAMASQRNGFVMLVIFLVVNSPVFVNVIVLFYILRYVLCVVCLLVLSRMWGKKMKDEWWKEEYFKQAYALFFFALWKLKIYIVRKMCNTNLYNTKDM